jgi:hypothetical protein
MHLHSVPFVQFPHSAAQPKNAWYLHTWILLNYKVVDLTCTALVTQRWKDTVVATLHMKTIDLRACGTYLITLIARGEPSSATQPAVGSSYSVSQQASRDMTECSNFSISLYSLFLAT